MGSEGTVLLTEEPSGLAARTIADALAHYECSPDTSTLALLDTDTHRSPTDEPVMTAYVDVVRAGEAAARAFRPFATLADGRLLFVLVDPNGEPVIVRPDPSVGAAALPPAEDDSQRAVMIDWIYLALAAMWDSGTSRKAINFLARYFRGERVERLSQLSTETLESIVAALEQVIGAKHVEFGVPRP